MKNLNVTKLISVIILDILLIFGLNFATIAFMGGHLYSKPTNVTAKFSNSALVIGAAPQIWNPTYVPMSAGDFKIDFQIHIFNNTNSMSYNYSKQVMQTLVYYQNILPGLNTENYFKAIFNFTIDISSLFNETSPFVANISIVTVSPPSMQSNTNIRGTTVIIQNNNITIVTVNPKDWGSLRIINTTFILESLIIMAITVGVLRYK